MLFLRGFILKPTERAEVPLKNGTRVILFYQALIASSPGGTVMKQQNILSNNFQIHFQQNESNFYMQYFSSCLTSVLSSSISLWNSLYPSLLRTIGMTQCFRLRFRCKTNHFLLLFNNKSENSLSSISSFFIFLC